MIPLAIGVQVLDLITFLIAAPLLVKYEVGWIGQVYMVGGPLLALSWKTAVMALVLLLAGWAGRYQRLILILLMAMGAIGLTANLFALWQVRSIL